MNSDAKAEADQPVMEKSTTSTTSNSRPPRKYGFACANCRKKKARCDGQTPRCRRCRLNNELCHFDKRPSVTHALDLETRIQHFDSLIRRLRDSDDGNRLRILNDYFDSSSHVNQSEEQTTTPTAKATQPCEQEPGTKSIDILEEVTLDNRGHLCFYGTTSLYHWRLHPESQSLSNLQNRMGGVSTGAGQSEADTVNLGDLGIDANQLQNLLDAYWCFPHHFHLVLCRRIFMRDLATSGPFVTPFLLYSVLSQAARYSDISGAMYYGDQFADKALSLLPHELRKGSSIPAIQGLLILSARECACGRTSQGWIYSGIAFRMMRDLGIHIPAEKLSHLQSYFSDEDLALRQQIFWSCYTWDKTMSLCLGRPPTIPTQMPVIRPQDILDGDEAETELWTPKFGTKSALESGTSDQARSNTRFSAYCELCIIIDDILSNLYASPRSTAYLTTEFLSTTLAKLRSWAESLQPAMHLRIESPAASCPPLHILLLNLLYNATVILLCRPFFLTQQDSRALATEAAQNTDMLLILHIRRFGLRNITFLESYTTFVASTVNILDLQTGVDPQAASARLSLTLEVLRGAASTPSNAKAIEAIERILRKGRQSDITTVSPSSSQNYKEDDVQLAGAGSERTTNPLCEPTTIPPIPEDPAAFPALLGICSWQEPNFDDILTIENSIIEEAGGPFSDILDGHASPAQESEFSRNVGLLNSLFVAPKSTDSNASLLNV